MTGTLTPRRPPAPAVSASPAPAPEAPRALWTSDPTLLGTIALTLLTLSVALGFGRLFNQRGFVWPVVLAALAAHGVAWWCRRNDLPNALSAVATLGAAALVGAWTVLGHTTAYGLPLPSTVRAGLEALGAARGTFRIVKAPTDAVPGFVLACVLALGVSAFMADWAAFRLQATFEAIIPAFSLFLFTAALGTAHLRTPATAGFAATTLAFVVVHGLARSNRAGAWFGGRPADGPSSLARNAAVLGVLAIVAGLVVGPHVPTAGDQELLPYKNRPLPGPTNRATVSPLVDIRGRLVDQRDLEVFTVKSPVKSYWRLTSLDTFNGVIWSSNDTYRATKGGIGTDEPLRSDLPTQSAEQLFSVSSLASIWLPAAFRPQHIEGVKNVSYNRDTASLITKATTTDGDEYRVRSDVPTLNPDLLASALPQAPPDIASRYLALPPIDQRVQAEAVRVTANATTPYAKARALQDYFHRGFVYDLNARPGHDSRALENFVLRTKRGYCEQYAGAYAVLARLIGLPTRIAVGFTPGELKSDGLYHVRDEHAHAWPEVYLHSFGWVAFEPTPGRGNPQAQQYTGLADAQDDSGNVDAPATTTTTAAPGDTADVPTTIDFGKDNAAGAANRAKHDHAIPTVWKLLLGAVLIAGLWAVIVPTLHARRRRQRRDRPGSVAAVWADWADTAELLSAAGITRRPAETMTEYARRAGASAGLQIDPSRALRQLANDAATAAYADGELSTAVVERSAAAAALVRQAIFDQVTTAERVKWWLDPRPLVGASSA